LIVATNFPNQQPWQNPKAPLPTLPTLTPFKPEFAPLNWCLTLENNHEADEVPKQLLLLLFLRNEHLDRNEFALDQRL
jgi:hypothetical protein